LTCGVPPRAMRCAGCTEPTRSRARHGPSGRSARRRWRRAGERPPRGGRGWRLRDGRNEARGWSHDGMPHVCAVEEEKRRAGVPDGVTDAGASISAQRVWMVRGPCGPCAPRRATGGSGCAPGPWAARRSTAGGMRSGMPSWSLGRELSWGMIHGHLRRVHAWLYVRSRKASHQASSSRS
jgi:hypothetical protein